MKLPLDWMREPDRTLVVSDIFQAKNRLLLSIIDY